jgi:hypothetical protein
MGLITPFLDYAPWISGTSDHNIVHDPAFGRLIEIDAETASINPYGHELGDGVRRQIRRVMLQKGCINAAT